MKLKNLLLTVGLIGSASIFAQETEKVDTLGVHEQRITLLEDGVLSLKKLKFSGYIQAQWQTSQLDSLMSSSNDMKVGTGAFGNEKTSNGNYNRYGIRRGRLKATYEDFGCKGVIEFDISESGLKAKDVYLSVLDPWANILTLKGGVFDNPFGYEIAYSSSSLESPERTRIIQTLFPDEKTLGAMITLQAPKSSPWNVLKLDAGLVAGNAISKDYKSKKDFVAHLTYTNSTPQIKYGIGLSTYQGYVIKTNANVYSVTDGAFVLDNTSSNLNDFAARAYYGADFQVSVISEIGVSSLRGEFITGQQPGADKSTKSPNGYDPTSAAASDTYVRRFQGGYVHFIQDIANTKHSLEVKYDWYDPNTRVKGSQIGVNSKTGKADMAYNTIGLGYIYRLNNNVKLTAYYDLVTNESTKIKGYFSNVKDNVFTLRLQYKF